MGRFWSGTQLYKKLRRSVVFVCIFLVWVAGEPFLFALCMCVCFLWTVNVYFFFLRFYLFFRERKGGRKRERNTVWLPLQRPLLGIWPIIQACALTRNRTGDPLVSRRMLNPLSHTSQGSIYFYWVATLSRKWYLEPCYIWGRPVMWLEIFFPIYHCFSNSVL